VREIDIEHRSNYPLFCDLIVSAFGVGKESKTGARRLNLNHLVSSHEILLTVNYATNKILFK